MPNILYRIKVRTFLWPLYTSHAVLIKTVRREAWLMLGIIVLGQAALPIVSYTCERQVKVTDNLAEHPAIHRYLQNGEFVKSPQFKMFTFRIFQGISVRIRNLYTNHYNLHLRLLLPMQWLPPNLCHPKHLLSLGALLGTWSSSVPRPL